MKHNLPTARELEALSWLKEKLLLRLPLSWASPSERLRITCIVFAES
jgi:hypothetical protein